MTAVMSKSFILDEIRRNAAEWGGEPLSQNRSSPEIHAGHYM
jgi:hypothetical protein